MKKKILFLIIALFMFMPLITVKASDITIDDIIERLNQRIYFSDSFIRQAGSDVTATKIGNNKIEVSATTTMSANNEEQTFTSFIIYEYENSTLSYKGEFGYRITGETPVNYGDSETPKDTYATLLNIQNKDVTKELIYVVYSLKTNEGYPAISTYLKSVGLENEDGTLAFPTENLPEGITITKSDDWVTEYSVNLDQISIPETIQTNSDEDNTEIYTLKTEDDKYEISFKDEKNENFELSVTSIMETYDQYLDAEKKTIDYMKTETEENGTFIDIYNIVVRKDIGFKTTGKFTFRIKMTDEMKKYNSFELINFSDDYQKQETIKLKQDGEYLEGELPHLSLYALVGNNIENPKTGTDRYIIPGSILLICTLSLYGIYKKKIEA